MTSGPLENLAKIGSLKAEPFSQSDFEGLLGSGERRLLDARNALLCLDSRFDLAYNASHALGLAALRLHGYRADNRYIVFQCLSHTLGLATEQWRILHVAHQKRNIAEYDGSLDVTEALLAGMLDVADAMLLRCRALEVPETRK